MTRGLLTIIDMDFTIITPNLNYGRFLGDCLESVAAQEGVTLEHLVVDGGSTDESKDVVEGFSHTTWTQELDDGMSHAINKGLEKAKGDWVMWLNADDCLKPGALDEVLRFAKQHREADVIYGSFDFVSENGALIRRMKLFGWDAFVSVHHCCYVPSTACFLKRSTIVDEGYRLNPEFHYVMDGELYARLSTAKRTFRYLPVSLADFRIHSENRSHSTDVGSRQMEEALRAERQHVESRVIRRVYGITLFQDPYLNGIVDGFLYIAAALTKFIRKTYLPKVSLPKPVEKNT